MGQIGFLDESNRLNRLSEIGDPLEKVASAVKWELFLPLLKVIFLKAAAGIGGRKPYDYLMMFKILLLQSWYNIADDNTEYLINDRLSFQRFLGLSLGEKVPDAKTIWLFREKITVCGAGEKLFELFDAQLKANGVITHSGSLVDATFVDVPRQRNNREENKKIKEGEIPQEWQKPENAHKLRQKDTDARWTKKNNETHFGFKDHVKVDKDSKLITKFIVTDASVHDSKEIVNLVDELDQEIYADSGYVGEEIHREIKEKNKNVNLKILQKGYRNRPLTTEQKALNKDKSRIRVRVEHVFGHMTNSMGGIFVRTIGIKRATCAISFKNLAYNISRYAFLLTAKKAMPLL